MFRLLAYPVSGNSSVEEEQPSPSTINVRLYLGRKGSVAVRTMVRRSLAEATSMEIDSGTPLLQAL
jgi:hypothetical protein